MHVHSGCCHAVPTILEALLLNERAVGFGDEERARATWSQEKGEVLVAARPGATQRHFVQLPVLEEPLDDLAVRAELVAAPDTFEIRKDLRLLVPHLWSILHPVEVLHLPS